MSYVVKLCERNQSTGDVDRTTITQYVTAGFSVVEKLDDSLDIGTITVRGLSTFELYDMFSWIEIYDDTTLLYSLRIAGDSVIPTSKNPPMYEHTLSLVEHTKILERFLISGKTFTQPTDGTIRYTLYSVLNKLIETTQLETSDLLSTTRICTLPTSGSLYSYLISISSPEFTFKDITLREAFAQVGSYINAIPRLFVNSSDTLELTFDFINELQDLISSSDDYINHSLNQNIDLYATSIESEALNLVNDRLISESVEIYPSKSSYISLRSDKYIFNFLNSYIPTPKPIYKIEKIIARIPYTVADNNGVYLYGSTATTPALFDIVIKDLIVEEDEYKQLPRLKSSAENRVITRTGNTLPFSKETTLTYSTKKRNIFVGDTSGIFDTEVDLIEVLDYSIYQMMIDDGYIDYTVDASLVTVLKSGTADIQDTVFQTHYTPIPNSTRLSIDRIDANDVSYNSSILSNQQGRVINLENFVNNLSAIVNRIGNSDLMLQHRVDSYLDLYSIGDYTSDYYIITEKEVTFYNDFIIAKYSLTKNFNKLSEFIGVNSEFRQWEIGEENTLERNLIYKEYVTINAVSSGNGGNTSKMVALSGYKAFMDTFLTSSVYTQISGGILTGTDVKDKAGTSTGYLIVPLSSNGGGNSLIFNFKFDNNKNASSYLDNTSSQYVNEFAPYTDSSGLSEDMTIYMVDEIDSGDTTFGDFTNTGHDMPYTDISFAGLTMLYNQSPLKIYKDSREIIGFTYHLQILPSDIKNVILGKNFALRNRLVNETPPTNIKLWFSTGDEQFTRLDTGVLDTTGYNSSTPTLTFDYTNYNLTVTNANLTSSTKSWCLTDEDNNILVAVNQNGTLTNVLTFDFTNKRSDVKYKY